MKFAVATSRLLFLMEEFTQEVGDIAPTPSAPRLVGALRSQASIPPADPQVVSRPTIGIADAFPSQATDLGNGAGSHLQDATVAELEKQLEEFRHQVANLENLNEELKSKNKSLEARHAEEATSLTEAQARESALKKKRRTGRRSMPMVKVLISMNSSMSCQRFMRILMSAHRRPT